MEQLHKFIPKMKYYKYNTSNNKLSFLRKSELKEIESINIKDYWILNQCFIHKSYIEKNEESRYKSNESLSYVGNYVRYLIIDRFLYKNRIMIEDKLNIKFNSIRKRIANPRINSDLCFKKGYIKYMLISDLAKESSSIVNGMAKHTINSLLGVVFLYDNTLDNKFVEIYLEHISSYTPEFEIDLGISNIFKSTEINNRFIDGNNKSSEIKNIKEYDHLFNSKLTSKFVILDGKESVDQQILYLANKIKIKSMYIASGFMYKSGLKSLNDIIKTIRRKGGNLEFIIGSLQNYNKYSIKENNKIIVGMDKDTAIYINHLIENMNLKIKTLEENFYHGKFFILEGEEKSCIVIGSSNVSNSAFNLNRELNILYVVENGGDNYNYFKTWYEDISEECLQLENLDEKYFNNTEIDYITNYSITKVKYIDFMDEINHLNDEEVKFRLNLWMDKNPDIIYSNLGIENLSDYYLFEYDKYQLIVLESFNPKNSFYCFKNQDIEELLFKLNGLTKTEIFELSSMDKRGYHIANRDKLESNINIYFTRRYKIN